MKRHLPVTELARDERFVRVSVEERLADPRSVTRRPPPEPATGDAAAPPRPARSKGPKKLTPERPDAPDAARAMMHGIFVGEIQALEGAGRTCFDFDTGPGPEQVPLQMKLDMARQCWDEARHCEISVKLADWMGTEVGEYAENTILYEAACHPDPVCRLTGVNRALEGLAIDVFNTMREFGAVAQDPVLEFCEDWMLADEVTHVKMGSDWLRRLTEGAPERRAQALEFQRVVDKLFSAGGLRGEGDGSPIQLARRFRELAGFSTAEVDEIAGLAEEAKREAAAGARRQGSATGT